MRKTMLLAAVTAAATLSTPALAGNPEGKLQVNPSYSPDGIWWFGGSGISL